MRPAPRVPRPSPPALVVLAAVAVACAGCTRRAPEGLPPGTEVEDLPASESWDARLQMSEGGRRTLEIAAPYLARYDRPDSSFVYLGPSPDGPAAGHVEVTSFEDDLRVEVAAQEAWFHEDEGRLVAQGRVRTSVSGERGAEIEAARMTMNEGAVVAEGDVQATVRGGGGARVRASRLATEADGSFVASGGAVVELTGDAQATVRARRVSGSGGGRYEAEGGVRVETAGGRTLEAGRVVWDEGAGQFRAPGAFSFDGPGERVRGVGLVASADLSRYSFRRASGQIEVRE